MTLYQKWLSHWALLKTYPSLALLCSVIALNACVALDQTPTKETDQPAFASIKNPESNETIETPESELESVNPVMEATYWNRRHAQVKEKNQHKNQINHTNLAQLKKNFNVKNRMSLKASPGNVPLNLASQKYSFNTLDTNINTSLREFAGQYNLDLYVDRNLEGKITVDFENLSLNKAMALLLGKHNYYWAWQDGLIRISRFQTKVFVIDYLRLTRTNQAANSSSIVSGTSKEESSERSSSSIQQNDSLAFWDELESQLDSLVSDKGRFVVNRLSGTIQITDTPTRVNEVETFLFSLQQALHRQVEIDTRILEVTLRNDHALGVDWDAISIKNIAGSLSTAITTSNNLALELKSNTVNLSYNTDNFSALISALEEQGSVNVVSQPRVRIINNQPALIKVGTDRTFFTQTASRFTTLNGGTEYVITEEPTTITEGLVLSVTPQISKDRWIMLDISPIITRVVDIITSPQGSTAPVLDIKQASTLIRAKDGEMVILGGLIQEVDIQSDRQVPFITKIPVIGRLFEGTYSTKAKKELIIFLIPRLIL